jgi:hypothetical protein
MFTKVMSITTGEIKEATGRWFSQHTQDIKDVVQALQEPGYFSQDISQPTLVPENFFDSPWSIYGNLRAFHFHRGPQQKLTLPHKSEPEYYKAPLQITLEENDLVFMFEQMFQPADELLLKTFHIRYDQLRKSYYVYREYPIRFFKEADLEKLKTAELMSVVELIRQEKQALSQQPQDKNKVPTL